MHLRIAAAAVVLAAAFVSPAPREARADGKVQQKPKATKASVIAKKVKLENARDAMRALAAMPAPKTLTAAQKKTFDLEMAKVLEIADGTDAVIKKIDSQIDQIKSDLDSMSEMGETESLRLQMAMDRLSKLMSTISNLLKKHSDTAQSITANLK